MEKKKAYRGQKPKKTPLNPAELRIWADDLTRLANRLHGIIADMPGLGVETLRPRPAPFLNAIPALQEVIEEMEMALKKRAEDVARQRFREKFS